MEKDGSFWSSEKDFRIIYRAGIGTIALRITVLELQAMAGVKTFPPRDTSLS